ncbi:MAG TPA: serine hydrolase domain-containing protein [Mycobacterium sp.]
MTFHRRLVVYAASACITIAAAACAAPQEDTLSAYISEHELLQSTWSGAVINNVAFTPPRNAQPTHEEFSGTLKISEAPMATIPNSFNQTEPWGTLKGDFRLFPSISISFFTLDGDLVPACQNIIQHIGASPWDILVQPGRVWSDQRDSGWTRAAFPFALVHGFNGGETYNGLALFLYRGNEVSNVRFQIVQQSRPYDDVSYFTGTGSVRAKFEPGPIENQATLAARYRASLAAQVPIADWSKLVDSVGGKALEGFDSGLPDADGGMAGIDFRGTFYLKYCASAGGPLPWCDRARFGVWSATKALANTTALLRLAKKYGPTVFDVKIADYLPGANSHPGWESVRFEDAINMATGFGNGSTRREPNDIYDGEGFTADPDFFTAHSQQGLTAAVLKNSRYPWGPGQVARYRNQDMFILGVAMNNFLKSKEGPAADIWSMLEREVFEPIGIYYAPTSRTWEPGNHLGHPIMAYGYYPTISDMVKIARLYQSDGRAAGGNQILYEPAVTASQAGEHAPGLPTGTKNTFGETTYFHAFWETPIRGSGGCALHVPVALGRGGNLVVIMPHGVTAIRLAKSPSDAANDPTSMLATGDQIAPFCS